MNNIADWQTLFAVQAGAAATLTGLVFVAVSINLPRIIATPGLAGRAAESLIQFLQVFFLSTAALIPKQPLRSLAIELLVIAVLSWVLQGISQIRYARVRSGHPLHWLVVRTVQTQIASIAFLGSSVLLVRGDSAGLYWLVPGFAFSFVAGVANAWVLLVEILR
jgi:modulator of FtsH protease